MSAEKKYTERDLVLAQRSAFAGGSRWLACWCDCNCGGKDYPWLTGDQSLRVESEAAKRYPLPKVTRPREVKDAEGDLWSVRDGVLGFRADYTGSEWYASDYFNSSEALGALRDLLNNPTEEVEDA